MTIRIALLSLLFTFSAGKAHALVCQEVKELVGTFFKHHFSVNSFDDELSKKTLELYIKSWDPAKLYFLQSDVDSFRKKYSLKLDNQIMKADCGAIKDIMKVYNVRFDETLKIIDKMLDYKFDFTKDEHLETDRKKIKFATDTKEIEQRWRKRIKWQFLNLKSTGIEEKAIRDKLKKRYQLVVKRHNEQTIDIMYSSFLDAFASALDPHSDYFTAEEVEDFRIDTGLSLEGIGAVLSSEDGITKIQNLVPGGAAFKTGKLKEGDKIIAVAQGKGTPVDVIDMDLRDVVKHIRGPRGTEVRLTIVRETADGNKKFVIPIIREKVKLTDREAKSYVYKVESKDDKGNDIVKTIGVIDLPSFYIDFQARQAKKEDFKSSAADIIREIDDLKKKKVDAVVLDLRSNGGGALDESIRIAGLFIDEGPVVQVRGLDGLPYVYKDDDPSVVWDGPLVVMINRQSASASEIFAGAIRDYERGIILGDSHTFGKGTVQNMADVPKMGAIKVTIQKFYRPLGASTQLEGVPSDIVLPSLTDELEIGEKYQEHALDFSQVGAVKVKNYNQVKPYLKKLLTNSQDRVKKSEDFKEVLKNIKEFNEKKDEKSLLSLKEEKASKEEAEEEEEENVDFSEMSHEEKRKYLVENDFYLREALMVAADYSFLLKNTKPSKEYVLPDLVAATSKKSASKTTEDVAGNGVVKPAIVPSKEAAAKPDPVTETPSK